MLAAGSARTQEGSCGCACHREPRQLKKNLRSKAPLRGFEDEKYCYVAFRRGIRPREPWPLDGMKFETLKEMKANRIPDNLEIDVVSQFDSEEARSDECEDMNLSEEADATSENDGDGNEEEEAPRADLGSGWGRIIYMPMRRGKRVELDVCRAANSKGTKGSFDRVVITQSQNPKLHHQARRSMWGDLWPLRSGNVSKFFM